MVTESGRVVSAYFVGGHPTPIADIVTECFPVAQKFQSLSYGPAIALLTTE